MSQLHEDVIYTVDGEQLNSTKAQRQSKRMFYFGFAFLPFLWFMNIWLFWPDFISPLGDPQVKRFTRFSAIGLTISSVLFWPWFFFYVSSGSKYISPDLYNKIDATSFPLSDYLGF